MIKHLRTIIKTIVVLASLGLLTACGAVGRTRTANTSDYDVEIAASAEIHDLGTEEYLITEINSGDISIESVYCNYIENILAPQIEDYFEITACKIDVSFLNGEIVSAEIRVVTEDDETNALETDIMDYVSKALGISTENITLSFDDSSENVTKEEDSENGDEDIKDIDLEGDESASQHILIAIEEANNQEDRHKSELAQDVQTGEMNIDENITNVNEINAQGGDIEFADTMTYKEFLGLGWTDDVDNSLTDDTLVYVVKIYYPNGFEHYKVGTINNCETIGIYRADNGEYLGGSFEERSK